MSQDRGKH